MSIQYTLEIENFSRGQNLLVNVNSTVFPPFSHLSAGTVGATRKAADEAKELIICRSFDHYLHLFTIQIGQSFPKAILRIKSSDGGKSYAFTLSNAYLEFSFIYNEGGTDELLEKSKFLFNQFSIKEDSPVGNTAKPGKPKKTKRK